MDLIRLATPRDARDILAVYTPYIENTVITFETEVPSVEAFASRIENTLEKFPYYVYVRDGKILGYAYASPFHPRAAYQWSCELSIYVDKKARHLGIGTKLYDCLEDTLVRMGYLNAYACITYPNPQSIQFHEKRGYQKVAHYHQCGYKMGKYLDVVWYERFLNAHKADPTAPVGYIED